MANVTVIGSGLVRPFKVEGARADMSVCELMDLAGVDADGKAITCNGVPVSGDSMLVEGGVYSVASALKGATV